MIAAVFNAKLRELSLPLHQDGTLEPVLLNSTDGGRIYRRSLVLLLTTAINELWQGTKVNVSYAIPDGGLFCILPERAEFSEAELAQLETHMRQIVAADDPITKQIVPLEQAVKLFEARGDDDKVRLLEQRTRAILTLYTLRGRSDYYYGYMVPSTRYLQTFALVRSIGGFILQYPHSASPTILSPIQPYPKIGAVFAQSEDWLKKLGVEDIGRLNHIVRNDRIQELILVAEALHERRIAEIAGEIGERHQQSGRAAGADRRTVVVRQDDLLQAAGDSTARLRAAPIHARTGQLLHRPRADPARRRRQLRFRGAGSDQPRAVQRRPDQADRRDRGHAAALRFPARQERRRAHDPA